MDIFQPVLYVVCICFCADIAAIGQLVKAARDFIADSSACVSEKEFCDYPLWCCGGWHGQLQPGNQKKRLLPAIIPGAAG
jgi:hypothetical protein